MLAKIGSYRKDVQWISGLIFVVLLTLGFLIGGLAKLFAPDVAKPILASQFKETILGTYGQNYDQMKIAFQLRPPTEPLQIPGLLSVGLTAGEAAQLDAQGFAANLSDKLAARIYEGDIDSLGPDARQSLGPLVNISKKTYETLRDAASGLAGAAAFWGFIMVLFGRRFGRLFSLGLTLFAAGILPSMVYDLTQSMFLSSPGGNPLPDAGMAALTAAMKPALEAGQQSVDAYIALGLLLILFAGFGRLVHWLSTRGRNSGKATAIDDTGQATGVHQTSVLDLRLPYDKTFDLCLASLGLVRGKIKQQERSLGKIISMSGIRWNSYGETLEFDIREVDRETTRVHVSSKPIFTKTLFDFGRNRANIEIVSEFLRNEERDYQVSSENPKEFRGHLIS